MDQRRRVLRCRDLLSRESFVITQTDSATGDVLLSISGSKAVLLTPRDVTRLHRHLDLADDDRGTE